MIEDNSPKCAGSQRVICEDNECWGGTLGEDEAQYVSSDAANNVLVHFWVLSCY